MNELPSKRRIMEICIKEPRGTDDRLRKLHYAFRKLVVLKAIPSQVFREDARRIFYAEHAMFLEKMKEIGDIVKTIGLDLVVFRDPYDFETSSEDYDYYYELKTEKQLIEEEAAREKAAKEKAAGEKALASEKREEP